MYSFLGLSERLQFVPSVPVAEEPRDFSDFAEWFRIDFLNVDDDVDRFRNEIPQRILADFPEKHLHPAPERVASTVGVKGSDAALMASAPGLEGF